LVWQYRPSASSQGSALSISIPEWCKSDGEASMGTLISNATSAVPGLFIVAPSTGKLLYWETASNATVMGFAKQKQSGLQGSISGLFYGERVTDVINAEPSGVILTLSTGRVAQITFRDPQGKPALSVNFLQSTAKLAAGGLFYGIRNVLGNSAWRKDIAAVRAGNSLFRGQRDIIVASTSGLFEIWDSHWNSVNSLRAEIDLQKDICSFLGLGADSKPESSLKVLDFVAAHKETKLSSNSEERHETTTLFILVAISRNTSTKTCAVIKAQLRDDNMNLLSSYILENVVITNELDKQKPSLHVAEPWDTAFILLGQKLWILSLCEIEPSPSAQLLDGVVSKPFQDRVQFQTGDKYEILGSGAEETALDTQGSGCLLMIRGFGLIHISTTPSKPDSVEYARVTAKQKIEQAVFYGTMSNTPLSFSSDGEPTFSVPEFEEAALVICSEILRSTSRFISRGGISLEQNFRLRSKALSDLTAELVRRRTPLSKRVQWELVWAGEKLAAQRSMWSLEEDFRRRWDSETFLSRVIGLMNDKFKTKYVPSDNNNQNDPVRQWFVRDTFQMQHIIPWIFNTIRGLKGPSGRSGPAFLSHVYQASELSLTILEEAYRFREDHAMQYGLGEENFDNGVFLGPYTETPEFWTSENMVYNETIHMLDLELDSTRSWMQQSVSKVAHADDDMLGHIGKNSCRRLRTLNKMLSERVRWLSAQDDPKLADEAIALNDSSQKQRRWQLYKMAGIGELHGAISLAEEFRDVEALVELMIELQDQIRGNSSSMGTPVAAVSPTVYNASTLRQKISGYFESFGDLWADAFFSRQIVAGQPGVLLSMKEYQSNVTRFLRMDRSYLPLSWINDIVGEEDYETASEALEKLALDPDTKLWDQRVQLSLAKLTKLASLEKTNNPNNNVTTLAILQRLDNVLEIGGIQDLTYDHILPALHSAIDQKAEIELAMEQFGSQIIDRPALRDLLEELLTHLIRRQALDADQLINLLTLIDEVQFLEGEESAVYKHQFYLALRVLRLSGYASSDPARHDFLLKQIWRRCIIRNDWRAISKADIRSDSDRKSLYRNTALASTLADCIMEGMLRFAMLFWLITDG
jgi:nuclear pore complex protein Nup133